MDGTPQGDISPRGSSPAAPRLGAYGLHLDGFELGSRWLHAAEPTWRTWRVTAAVLLPATEQRPTLFDNSVLQAHLDDGTMVHLDRAGSTATFGHPDPRRMLAAVHPWATVVAAADARWAGDAAFHAAAVGNGSGDTWIVLGGQGDGKSTAAALLRALGWSVLADDLVVVREGSVAVGPRCIDARPSFAPLLEQLLGIPPVEVLPGRLRFPAGDTPAGMARVTGFVRPLWGDAVELADTATDRRLAALLGAQGSPHTATTSDIALASAALPMIDWTRPQRPETALASAAALSAALSGGDISSRR